MTLEHNSLIKYIESLGWKHAKTIRYGTQVFSCARYDEDILIPTDTELSDYTYLLDMAVQHISKMSEISVRDVLEKISFQYFDIIRFRVDSHHAKDGTLPLDIWAKHYDLTVGSVRAAALNIVKNQKKTRLTTGEAAAYANKCKIGQTEVGSYITKAIVPIGGNFQIPLDEKLSPVEEQPYGRQLSVALLKSASLISRVSKELESTSKMPSLEELDGNWALASLTRKICSSYGDLVEVSNKDADIHINIQESSHFPISHHINNKTFIIESKYIDHIKEISKVISVDYMPKYDTIEGFITELKKDTSNPEVSVGTITLFTGDKKVKIILEEEDYKIALKAHDLKTPISIAGLLNKRKNRWHLDDAKQLFTFLKQV